ncbi:MAG: type II secretion system protein [Parvibaculales bacterium]
MNIRAKSEKGFSLIELLVVVAIIGVLAAVGVVGYQGYIDSTKKSVTDANAKAVHQWLINTKTVRAAGIDVDPSECSSSNFANSTTAASAVATTACFRQLGAAGGPFESFKNPYETTRSGQATILATAYSSAVADSTTCETFLTGAKMGDIIIQVASATVAQGINVYFCSKVGDNDNRLTKRDTTINNF